jgi:hypothetical protein
MNPALAPFLCRRFPGLKVHSLILGAAPACRDVSQQAPVAEKSFEPWRQLPALLPGSDIFGVDADGPNCWDAGIEKAVIGWPGLSTYYDTVAPMCGSLYRPDPAVLDRYAGLEVARETGRREVQAVGLDRFAERLRPIHFIQADIQGAEADAFRTGTLTLQDCLAVMAEVEFVRLYAGQPLFGDVNDALRDSGLEFHTFLGFAIRPLHCSLEKVRQAPFPQQILWADAVWYRRPETNDLAPENLARLAVLADLYGHRDLACLALDRLDPALGRAYAENTLDAQGVVHV